MRHRWQTAIGLAVSLVLLYWALHDLSLHELLAHVRAANVWLLIIAIINQTALFAIRAARWQIFLKPVLADSPFRPRFAATCIGFMVNNLLPARVGEFARAYAFSRIQPVSVSASFGSLVVERLFDALTLAVFLAVPLFSPGLRLTPGLGDELVGKLIFVLLVLGGATLALLVLIWRPALAISTFRFTVARLLPRKLADVIVQMIESFVSGLGAMRSPELVLKGFAWSFLHWGMGAFGLYLGMLAFGIVEPGYLGAVFLQGVNAVVVAVPSSPGFFGLYEASVRLALTPFGVDPGRAVSFAFAFHIGSFIPVTVIGLYYLGRLGLTWSEVGHSEEIVEESP
ncbi:MAG TPA: lysylphosphatidylglycerol synthase transmembrane domain-containing protein [Gemmatimonadota bacterium]|nr:lysylphosphatidylglycerol synthase transmembrane domain-containing protein [Gemmatimonadota bacterium]